MDEGLHPMDEGLHPMDEGLLTESSPKTARSGDLADQRVGDSADQRGPR